MGMSQQGGKGAKVILAGAGPGDAELITIKLQKYLAQADVIITDRLVNPEIIALNARKDVRVIMAGKQGYNDASFTQEQVNAVILESAKEGKLVLRLKGGDTAFFSNILDELEMLVRENLPFEIVPGITAASGASAYTGIPLTARGYAQGVQFIAFNPNAHFSDEQWRSLAITNDTRVFYMGVQNLKLLTGFLLQYQCKPDTPLAVLEQAATPFQQVHISTLQNCVADFEGRHFSSPSLILLGDVVRLYPRFSWFQISGTGTVFRALEE